MSQFASRAVALSCLSAAVACCMAQSVDDPIEFKSDAVTVRALVEALSAKSGIDFKCSNMVAGDVVLVRSSGEKLSTVMARIADAVTGEWVRDGNGYLLNRDLGKVKLEDQKYLAHRTALIKGEIDKATADAQKMGGFDAEKALKSGDGRGGTYSTTADGQSRSFRVPDSNSAPIGRAMARVLSSFNASDLAAIPRGTRVVYSTNRTQMQKQMPSAALKALNQFVEEQNAYVQAAGETGNSNAEGIIFLGANAQPLRMQGGPGKALVIVTRGASNDDLSFELKIYDQQGNSVGSLSRRLGFSAQMRQPGAGNNPTGNPSTGGTADPIPLSATAQEIAAHFSRPGAGASDVMVRFIASDGGPSAATSVIRVDGGALPFAAQSTGSRSLSNAARALIERPDRNDPLGNFTSELLNGLAGDTGNIVALIPDSVLVPLATRALMPITPADLEKLLKDNLDMAISHEGNWTVVGPQFPTVSRMDRADRGALSALLRGIAGDGSLSLDEMGRYARTRSQPNFNGLESAMIGALYPHVQPTYSTAVRNWRMMQFYALLDPNRRADLRANGAMPIDGLSIELRNILFAMVYNDPNGPFRMMPPAPAAPGARRFEQTITRTVVASGGAGGFEPFGFMDFGGSLMDERTELLPAGLPSGGVLRLQGNAQQGVFASQSNDSMEGRFFTPEEYGMYQGISERMSGGPRQEGFPNFSSFRPASVTHLEFTFEFSQIARMSRSLDENLVDMKTKPVSYNLLPNDFIQRAEAQRKLAAERSQQSIEVGGTTGRRNIPPR